MTTLTIAIETDDSFFADAEAALVVLLVELGRQRSSPFAGALVAHVRDFGDGFAADPV